MNINKVNTSEKYFFPSLPTVSVSKLLIKLKSSSAATCILDGYKSLTVFVFFDFKKGTVKNININAVVTVIHKAELVNEISNPKRFMSIIGWISNCFRGLSSLAMMVIKQIYLGFSMRRISL